MICEGFSPGANSIRVKTQCQATNLPLPVNCAFPRATLAVGMFGSEESEPMDLRNCLSGRTYGSCAEAHNRHLHFALIEAFGEIFGQNGGFL